MEVESPMFAKMNKEKRGHEYMKQLLFRKKKRQKGLSCKILEIWTGFG